MSSRILIIDRIENDIAVLEFSNQTYQVPIDILPDVKEGDQIEIIKITPLNIDAKARLERLKLRSPKSDDVIDL